MPIKILVMCQRKAGRCYESTQTVEDTIVPIIEQYLSNYLHTRDYKIDYLSQLEDAEPDDKVDFNIEVDNNPQFTDFLKEKAKYYSIIVLNKCPYRFINFDYVSQLLCNNGVVILSKVNCKDAYNTNLFTIPPTHAAIAPSNILDFFTFKDGFYIKININANATKRSPLVITNGLEDDTDPGVKTRSQRRKLTDQSLNDAKKGGKRQTKTRKRKTKTGKRKIKTGKRKIKKRKGCRYTNRVRK